MHTDFLYILMQWQSDFYQNISILGGDQQHMVR